MKMNKITTLLCAGIILAMTSTAHASELKFTELFGASPEPNDNRVISISGEIDSHMAEEVVASLKSMDKDNHDEIEIDITSYGGEIYSGFKIIDAMAAVKSPIKTVCEGYCMSMAAVILASGSAGRRVSMAHATILLHQASGGVQGKIDEMENELKEAERVQNVMLDILKQHTGLTAEVLNKAMDHDNFMSPEQAHVYNLIDSIEQ